MHVIIHRGTHQIGGCATELRTRHTRILIDFGAPLPDEEGNVPDQPLVIDGLNRGKPDFDAVFLTHYHGDHLGLIGQIPPTIPIYMGKGAIDIYRAYTQRVGGENLAAAERIRPLEPYQKVRVGDMTITPLPADHSAFDALMYLVETPHKRVLHTGDFRLHGPRGGNTVANLEQYAKGVDCLITEGTQLSRQGGGPSEEEIARQIKELVAENKYVFALCASTNIDRLSAFCQATPRGRYLVCDEYQQKIMAKAFSSKALYYDTNLDEKLRERGFVMLVRANSFFAPILEKFPEAVMIYSMWGGYLTQPDGQPSAIGKFVAPFQEGKRFHHLHASGHASPDAILTLCQTLQPRMVIPIHTRKPEALAGRVPQLRLAQDGEVIDV